MTCVLISFIFIVIGCLACRKRIRQPVFDAESTFMQTFIEDEASTRANSDLQPLKEDFDEEQKDCPKNNEKQSLVKAVDRDSPVKDSKEKNKDGKPPPKLKKVELEMSK